MLKTGILLGSIFSLATVVLGAFGAHALKDQLNEYGKSIYEKAILYQMFHSLAVFFVALLNQYFDSVDLTIVVWLFVAGIILFSGSLYILAVSQIKWFGAITPIGGVLFLAGWILLIFKTLSSNI